MLPARAASCKPESKAPEAAWKLEDALADKLDGQIRKRKGKVTDHHRREAIPPE